MNSIADCISSLVMDCLPQRAYIVAPCSASIYDQKKCPRLSPRALLIVFGLELERKLGAELNSARIAYLNDLSKGGRGHRDLAGGGEISKVRAIEHVEAFGAKLQPHLAVFAETNVLKE